MKLLSVKKILIISTGIFVAGCAATSGVLSKGGDIYTINVYRADISKVKLRAYQNADKFCALKSANGVVIVKEDLRSDPSAPTGGIIDLDFKCEGPVTSKIGMAVVKSTQKEVKKAP
jgi:hypothetical protein